MKRREAQNWESRKVSQDKDTRYRYVGLAKFRRLETGSRGFLDGGTVNCIDID